ncbi:MULTISPECIES: hypothetical protein [Actinotignum]|uniref:hypothetical protein n=1 Tax=Actinotignum TaxID=1653174 RepID=UPI00254DD750|nr:MULTISPECIES: hypothetical protein [Actinotignum]MDK7272502.1 hypothetical protein [Actinotignum schaalii]MDY5145009.1 hypothetical protein [Actinotignum timonense]
MEAIFLFVSAVSNAMSAWTATLTLWGYGPKPTPATPSTSQTPRMPDMPSTPGVASPGVVINAEHIIINGPVFITNSRNVAEPRSVRDTAHSDGDTQETAA